MGHNYHKNGEARGFRGTKDLLVGNNRPCREDLRILADVPSVESFFLVFFLKNNLVNVVTIHRTLPICCHHFLLHAEQETWNIPFVFGA